MLKGIVTLALLSVALPAQAFDLSVKVEPGVAAPLTDPQARLFGLGGAGSVMVLLGLTPYLDVGPSATFNLAPATASGADAGMAWALGGGLRLKTPHQAAGPSRRFFGASPWLDADALYVRTGDLNRPGFAVGVGVAFPVDHAGAFWLGPFARYLQIIQGERAGYDNRDSRTLIVGLSLEIGGQVQHEPTLEPVVEPAPVVKAAPVVEPPPVVEAAPVVPPPDRDHDGITDASDRCPDVPGTAENFGCPPYQQVVIKADKIEIKQKVYFDFDEAAIKPISFPLLNEVAKALEHGKGLRVQVQGHADSTGSEAHNQTLSAHRAVAVVEYLVAHGVQRDRLEAKGFSSSEPVDTNTTAAGRENNRRVEFIILNDGSSR